MGGRNAAGTHCELGGTTTDVHHQVGATVGGQRSSGPAKGQLGLLGAGEQLGFDAQEFGERTEQVVPIGGVACSRGGRYPQARHLVTRKQLGILREDRQRAPDRLGIQP